MMLRAEPGIRPKQWPEKNEWQKKVGLLNWEDRCGIGRAM